jgi:hypothetical protein
VFKVLILPGLGDAAAIGEFPEPIARVARAIKVHLQRIYPRWIVELTAAPTKGVNNLFVALKRKARGYQPLENMSQMLYSNLWQHTRGCY